MTTNDDATRRWSADDGGRAYLRTLPVLTGTSPTLDLDVVPAEPMSLFVAWHFAVSSVSQKGRDLTAHPAAALTFYWPTLVRQIRVIGTVVDDGAQASAEDFLARPQGSRAMALTLRQSQPLHDIAELDAEIGKAHHKLADDPAFVPEEWTSCAVRPGQVEFWQGSPDRRHWRVSYQRTASGWDRARLWP